MDRAAEAAAPTNAVAAYSAVAANPMAEMRGLEAPEEATVKVVDAPADFAAGGSVEGATVVATAAAEMATAAGLLTEACAPGARVVMTVGKLSEGGVA